LVTRALRIVPSAFTAVTDSLSEEDTVVLGSIGTVSVSGASSLAGVGSGWADFVGGTLGGVATFNTVTPKEVAILIVVGVTVGNVFWAIGTGGTSDQCTVAVLAFSIAFAAFIRGAPGTDTLAWSGGLVANVSEDVVGTIGIRRAGRITDTPRAVLVGSTVAIDITLSTETPITRADRRSSITTISVVTAGHPLTLILNTDGRWGAVFIRGTVGAGIGVKVTDTAAVSAGSIILASLDDTNISDTSFKGVAFVVIFALTADTVFAGGHTDTVSSGIGTGAVIGTSGWADISETKESSLAVRISKTFNTKSISISISRWLKRSCVSFTLFHGTRSSGRRMRGRTTSLDRGDLRCWAGSVFKNNRVNDGLWWVCNGWGASGGTRDSGTRNSRAISIGHLRRSGSTKAGKRRWDIALIGSTNCTLAVGGAGSHDTLVVGIANMVAGAIGIGAAFPADSGGGTSCNNTDGSIVAPACGVVWARHAALIVDAAGIVGIEAVWVWGTVNTVAKLSITYLKVRAGTAVRIFAGKAGAAAWLADIVGRTIEVIVAGDRSEISIGRGVRVSGRYTET
jgi:hypothetical protein